MHEKEERVQFRALEPVSKSEGVTSGKQRGGMRSPPFAKAQWPERGNKEKREASGKRKLF